MSDIDKTKIEILIKEYDLVTGEIQTRIETNEKVMGLGLTILALGFTLAIKDKVNEILLFMPVGFLAMLFYSLLNNITINSLGGYRQYLQERINFLIGERTLIWERMSERLVHRNFIIIPLYSIYALVLGFSIYISLSSAWLQYRAEVFIITATIIGILLISYIVAIFIWFKAFRKAHQLAWSESNYISIEMQPNKSLKPTTL